ncbi:hypothetical protein CW304_21235 [Bacillus sp. UFRGS-B20]|nr:hypothetical protein CW304_21235 [Bacillus sp. UFRGS-B20]
MRTINKIAVSILISSVLSLLLKPYLLHLRMLSSLIQCLGYALKSLLLKMSNTCCETFSIILNRLF